MPKMAISHLYLNSYCCIDSHVCIVSHMHRKPPMKKSIARVAASTVVMTAGLGLAGLGAAASAQAQPAPFPDRSHGDTQCPTADAVAPDPTEIRWACHGEQSHGLPRRSDDSSNRPAP